MANQATLGIVLTPIFTLSVGLGNAFSRCHALLTMLFTLNLPGSLRPYVSCLSSSRVILLNHMQCYELRLRYEDRYLSTYHRGNLHHKNLKDPAEILSDLNQYIALSQHHNEKIGLFTLHPDHLRASTAILEILNSLWQDSEADRPVFRLTQETQESTIQHTMQQQARRTTQRMLGVDPDYQCLTPPASPPIALPEEASPDFRDVHHSHVDDSPPSPALPERTLPASTLLSAPASSTQPQ